MGLVSRRQALAAAATTAGLGLAGRAAAEPAQAPAPALVVTPRDPRYGEMVVGYNRRWVGTPESIRVATTPAQVAQVVREAVRDGKRIAVRSGGHCYADFVSGPQTQILLDVSGMNDICYDPSRRAFCVESGAQLGRIYETLYRAWGVTIPGGICLTVGIGGHVAGGGFGMLSRQHGLVADHLEAVETVVVDRNGTVRTVIASRSENDPNRDLWWATTGAGGGCFGVNTRYWFRAPGATGADPARQLPSPPKSVHIATGGVPWAALTEDQFVTMFRNYSTWHEQNSAPGSAGTALCGVLFGRTGFGLGLMTHVDATAPGAAALLADYGAALTRGTGVTVSFEPREVPWLASTKVEGSGTLLYDPTLRSALKTAWLRKGLTNAQFASIYRNLRRPDAPSANGIFQLVSVGGQINAVPRVATASVHRDAVMFGEFESFWSKAGDDAANMAWLRDLYGQAFAETGGYPVPGELVDGCYINNPDTDITDPAINRSGVDWTRLYFGENYPRLQQVKARWDPTDFFRHAQSIRRPA